MSRRDQKKRQWLFRRNRKHIRRLHRRKKHHYSIPLDGNEKQIQRKREKKRQLVTAPLFFSLFSNYNETAKFFEKVETSIDTCTINSVLFFDLQNIENLSVDAVMYLIATIRNNRRVSMLRIRCRGNIPREAMPREKLGQIGFYDYVTPISGKTIQPDVNRIRILSGSIPDSSVIQYICDFVCGKCNYKDLLHTKLLYAVILELMVNVSQHAYRGEEGRMKAEWYVYVEDTPASIRFVFLDTGLGIPATIRKKFTEKMSELVSEGAKDATFIADVLLGKFRTETGQSFRGKGLPNIYQAFLPAHALRKLKILSGRGFCQMDIAGDIKQKTLDSSFEGTLFSWDFYKVE